MFLENDWRRSFIELIVLDKRTPIGADRGDIYIYIYIYIYFIFYFLVGNDRRRPFIERLVLINGCRSEPMGVIYIYIYMFSWEMIADRNRSDAQA